MKKRKFMAGLLAGVLLLAGCGGGGSDSKDSGELDQEQYFNTYVDADPTSFDSGKATDTNALNMLVNLMEPLLRVAEKEDGTLEFVKAGAEDYTVSEDGLVWTFTIRENKWSDGQPVTAQDYAYGISRVLDPNLAAPYSYLFLTIQNAYAVNGGEMPVDQLGVEATDEKTLVITLETPTAFFESPLCHSAMLPVRQDLAEKYGDQYGTAVDKMAYNGPFKAESWVHNNEVVFVKNDSYWEADAVKLSKISYKIIQDENAIYNSLENGSIDSATILSKEWTDNFLKDDRLVHKPIVMANTYYQYYNQMDPLFANANVRKAFTLAIDREDMNEVVFDGMRVPAYSMVPNGVTVGDKEYVAVAKQPIKSMMEENKDPKALLVKGLGELGMDTDPTKLTVTLSMPGTDQFTKTMAEYMQQVYKKNLGVNLKIQLLDWGAFSDDWYNYEYQIGQMAFGAEWNDPLSMLNCQESSQDGYCIGWGSDEMDALIAEATGEADDAKRIALVEDMEELFVNQEGCVSPLTFLTKNYFTYEYVKGMEYAAFSTNGYKYVYTAGR